MRVTTGEYVFEIPDCATRKTVLDVAKRPHTDLVYGLTSDGQHRVLHDGETISSLQSDRIGFVSPFRAALRDVNRIRAEIKLLEAAYGRDSVVWSPDYSWIMVQDWRLPPEYNSDRVNIIILVPDQYGYGPSYNDCFVPAGLRIRQEDRWTSLPHYFEKFAFVRSQLVNELQRQGWSYVSVHPTHWGPSSNITTFLTQVYTFLSAPFADWDE